MNILAIDPGTTESAYALYERETGKMLRHGKLDNEGLLQCLHMEYIDERGWDRLAVEMVACYGMPVGAEVFGTCVWIGRFIEAWGGCYEFVYRKDEKMLLCGSMRAKDANIRQAIIDRYGGRATAIGTKKEPGPLYGMRGDEWAALAVALVAEDKLKET